jgi:hypothetical protein
MMVTGMSIERSFEHTEFPLHKIVELSLRDVLDKV